MVRLFATLGVKNNIMPNEEKMDITGKLAKWLLTTTGSVLVLGISLALPVLAKVIEEQIPKELMLVLLSFQSLLLVTFLVLAKKAHECQNKSLAIVAKKASDLSKVIYNLKQPRSYQQKWGCLVFEDDGTLYCPKCYLEKNKKTPTSRKSIKFRYCPACQADLPAG